MRQRSATDIQTKLKRKGFSKQKLLLEHLEKAHFRITYAVVMSATADSSGGELSEAKHLWPISIRGSSVQKMIRDSSLRSE
jgi:hypothetical protein